MRIKWLGHSCFKISSKNGIRIVTDPFDDNLGYRIPSVETDIVTVSHGHYDHNFVDCLNGDFEVIDKVGDFNVKGIPIRGVHTFHDEEEGAKRGGNIVYTFVVDDIKICHLGDLGHLLTPSQLEMIGDVDVLLIPVGGVYTIAAAQAVEVIKQLKPAVVVPMHYKTKALRLNVDPVEGFEQLMGKAEKPTQQVVEIKKDELDKNNLKVYILRYE
jgi:L-ascorbate metabolism protein UlaG (beta-lactamase superfamily)